MNLVKRAGCLAVLLILLGVGGALAQQPVVGRDYTLINPPQPTTSGNKIEVLEFFWYGCIHCYHLESCCGKLCIGFEEIYQGKLAPCSDAAHLEKCAGASRTLISVVSMPFCFNMSRVRLRSSIAV